MESYNIERFITQSVEQMLPNGHDDNICLGMKVKMDWTDNGYDDDGNTKVRPSRTFSKKYLLIFYRPSNYTLVLMKDVSEERYFMLDKQEEMELEQLSHHDSCWRSDGMRWVFKTFAEAWEYFEEFGIEGRKISPMIDWDIFGGAPSHYLIEKKEQKTDPDDDRWNRWIAPYIMKLGRKIPMKEISQYMQNT